MLVVQTPDELVFILVAMKHWEGVVGYALISTKASTYLIPFARY